MPARRAVHAGGLDSDPAGGAVRSFARRLRPDAGGDRRASEDLPCRRSARQAEFTPRATFAKNFFEAAGIEVIGGAIVETPALAAAFKASGAALACLCSSDKVYEREAAATAQALKTAGARHIYLAGRPARAGERA